MFLLKAFDTPFKVLAIITAVGIASASGIGVAKATLPEEYVKNSLELFNNEKVSNYEFYLNWGEENALKNMQLDSEKNNYLLLFFKQDMCNTKDPNDMIIWGKKVKIWSSTITNHIKCFEII